ncbi:MAG: carbonic anhydrase family protein [Stenomitos rutilans HA7619-LM2]|jgi:carbonic anhydrase|nr:carbonic anhydrase family protein [Stenomitos rutilans HA7619-LM2]
MDRRNLLKLLTIGGVGTAVGVGGRSLTAAIASENHAEWGYVGAEDPTHWGDLSADYQACKAGQQQSPVNLQKMVKAELSPIQVAYHDIPLRVLNNGHTIQINAGPGNQITLNGTVYELIQFHFHHPSEHSLMSKAYPMELHLVHKDSKGELAVLGVFLQAGKENDVLKPIWAAMPSKKQPEKVVSGAKVPISSLLPAGREAYEYFGSLTTPPCSEIVNWVVFHDPIEVSQAQIDQFTRIFPLNARPVQPLNHRFLLDVQSS